MSEQRVWVTDVECARGGESFRDDVENGNVVRRATGRYDAGEITVTLQTSVRDPRAIPPDEVVEAVEAFFNDAG